MLWRRIIDLNPIDHSKVVIMTTTLKIYTASVGICTGLENDSKFSNLIFIIDDDFLFLGENWLSSQDKTLHISASSVLYWADLADIFTNLMNSTNITGVPVQSKFVADLINKINKLQKNKTLNNDSEKDLNLQFYEYKNESI